MVFITLLSALSFMTSSAQLQSDEGIVYHQVYYIVGSSSNSCPVAQSCLTLSQFARNTSLYLMENTTLIFKDEIHTLDSQLLINDANQFSAIAERMTTNSTIIICRKSFVFENLNDVYINGLLFIGCKNNIKSVVQFSIENCTFDGQHGNGTALFITDSTVNITRCRFIRTLGISYHDPLHYYRLNDQIVGGAIIGNSCDISISESFFEENKAQVFGAVIVIQMECKLVITNTIFYQNQVTLRAWGIYADNGCSVAVINSSFFVNALDTNIYRQSTLIIAQESNISLQECIFNNNSGGFLMQYLDSNVTLMDTLVEFNHMLGFIDFRKIFLPASSNLDIVSSVFNSNNAFYLVLAAAGCVIGNCSTLAVSIQLQSSLFVNNIMIISVISISVLDSGTLSMRVQDCIFAGNRAKTIDIWGGSTHIDNCSFADNRANDASIYIVDGAMQINGCIFASNRADYGAVLFAINCSTTIFDTLVVNNTADVSGINRAQTIYIEGGSTHIDNCSFADNRANDGSIYVVNGVMQINGCIFASNRADYGAVLLAINCSTTIFDTLVVNNTADVSGILLIYDGVLRSHGATVLNNIASTGVIALTSCTATFEGNTTLINNTGSFYAVASDLTFYGSLSIANCTQFFVSSQQIPINEGGAITIFQSSVKFNENVNFINNDAENGGALFISESRVSFNGLFTISSNHANQEGGGIYLYHSRLNIQGTCRISNNVAREGGGIYGLGSTITLEEVPSSASVIVFEFNSAKLGGALYLASNTKLYSLLIASLIHQINFTENTADYGGAVYIADETELRLCDSPGSTMSTGISTECFIQILALYPLQLNSTSELQETTVSFLQNSAKIMGEAIFGGLLDRCTVSQLNPKREQGLTQGYLYLKSISNINNTDLLASHPVRLCYCFNDQPDCSMKLPPIHVKKGQTFNVSLVAVDQVNHTLASNVTAFVSSNGGLSEGQQYQSLENRCTNLSYNVFTPHESEELLLNAVGPCGSAHLSQSHAQLIFLNCTCPIGFQPVAASLETDCRCECHSNVTNYVEMCNSSTKTLKTKANTWVSNTTISELGESYLLIHPHCPYDYCRQDVAVNLNQRNGADSQCAFQRRDTLCGACKSGYSLSFGSSQCIKCKSYWPVVLISIILLAVIAGIALVSALLYLELTVAIGTLNGIIFYANIINGNANIFFKQLRTPNFPSYFIAWLNLDIGFDACLFEGIDAVAKTWLQLAFPIYLIMLVVIVIVASKYSQRFSNLIGKKNPVATLATLILLSYTKILSTIITMLSLITLDYPDGKKLLWKPDATVAYLEFPRHVFLFLTATLILVIGILYTVILFFWQWLIRSPNWKIFCFFQNPKLLSFVETYHAPLKPSLRFWTGLLLLSRVIFYLISALSENPQVSLTATMIIAGSLLVLSATNVYKKNLIGILEISIIYNIFIFTTITWYTTDTSPSSPSNLQYVAVYISTMTTFVLLCCVIIYHCYMYTRIYSIAQMTTIVTKLNKIFKPQSKNIRRNLDLQIGARDVDIFEMVDNSLTTNDYQLAKPQLEPQNVTVSIIEIPKQKEEKSNT